jgi:hypothetical protein
MAVPPTMASPPSARITSANDQSERRMSRSVGALVRGQA